MNRAQTVHMVQRGVWGAFVLLALLVVLPGCQTPELGKDIPKPETVVAYETAVQAWKDGNYAAAAQQLSSFLSANAESPLAESAMYYLGRSQESQGNGAKATATYQKLVEQYKGGVWVKLAELALEKTE